MRAFLFAVVAAGCAPFLTVPTAMHPTPSASDKSVGVAVGGAYVNPEGTQTDIYSVPHGEGWIHLPVASAAQVGVHVAPNIGHLALRFDVVPLGGGVGFAVQPFVGGGYAKVTEEEQTQIAIAAGASGILLVPAGAGHAWVVPKVGFGWFEVEDADGEEKNKTWTIGLSAGAEVASGVSVELTVHRMDDLEDEEMFEADPEPIWVVVPTVGVRH